MAQQQVTSDNVGKNGNPTNPVDLIFPLQKEITLQISELPSYINKLSTLFEFYDKQLAFKNQQIEGYNLKNEIPGLITFLINLQIAIEAAKAVNPSSFTATDPEKTTISDYEFITLKIIDDIFDEQPDITPVETEYRDFSDGSKRQVKKEVIIYNKIDYIYLTNKTLSRNMAVMCPIQTANFAISPSTLSLVFNIKQIVEKQINSPIPAQLLLCAGKETALSKIDDGFSIFGFDITVLTSKVGVEDFLNAYIHPIQKIVTAPKPKLTGCTPETKRRIDVIKGQITLYNLQKSIAGSESLLSAADKKRYIDNKKELLELTKLCPENTNQIILFENIKNLDKLGKIFADFLQKFNIACIVDEAIKCVMPQIPCEEILRDLSVENFESRLKTAFPYQQQIITAIVEKVNTDLEEENNKRIQQGQEPLDPAGQSQKILDTINSFIDLEALCKLDIQAIIELIKSILNIDLSVLFNLFDWQFSLKIDFQLAILEALLQTLLALIEKILNELIGCAALDGLIAGIIAGNIDTSSGLYGDLASMFGGDPSFGNFQQILDNNLNNFLSQSSNQLANLIRFEASGGNSIIQTSFSGTAGVGTSLENLLVSDNTLKADAFGGLISQSVRNSGSVGLAGFKGQTDTLTEFDVTKLASSEGQKEFLKEIGKFQISSSNGDTVVNRISDDSIVEISKTLNPNQVEVTNPSRITLASTGMENEENIFTVYNLRDKNKHILNALLVLNERENRSSIYVSQANLGEQIKDFVKTCFTLLSPSETIDLITGNASEEVKLTVTGISQVRYPLLYALFRYPDRHASLFASFGALSGLNTLGARLQILAMSPSIKQKLVDPNVCAPFSDIYDFRKAIMQQSLPEDLANKLIDDLLEDDRKRANALLDSLSKPPNLTDIATNPNALALNKTPDGKPIEEIDNALDNVLDSILDQVKIAFDKDIDGLPAATSLPLEDTRDVTKTQTAQKQTLFGFKDPGTPKEIENQEYIDLKNTTGTDPGVFKIKTHKKITGELFKSIFGGYSADIQTGFSNETTETQLRIAAKSSLEQNAEIKTAITASNSINPQWLLDYSETTNGKFKFVIKTVGDIQVASPPAINFSEKINFSGSLTELDEITKQNILNIGLEQNATKLSVFNKILKAKMTTLIGNTEYTNANGGLELLNNEIKIFLKNIIEKNFREQNFIDSKLLQRKNISSTSDPQIVNPVLLDLIDFTPKQTEEQKACGIDTHILQLEAVKKRIKDEFNNTVPQNLINTDSRVNTRYSDNNPGHLSKQVMFGLVDTFIRTSVIHTIFKGLFIFDKYLYNLNAFSYPYIIYMFIENRVQKDIKETNLSADFENEYEKIVKKYIDEELIPSDSHGTNFTKIVKYHIDSVLSFLNKLINGDKLTLENLQNVALNIPIFLTRPELFNLNSVSQIDIDNLLQDTRKNKNKQFLNNIIKNTDFNFHIPSGFYSGWTTAFTPDTISDTYSNFLEFQNYGFVREVTEEERRSNNRELSTTDNLYIGIPQKIDDFEYTSNVFIAPKVSDDDTLFGIRLEKYITLSFEDSPPLSLLVGNTTNSVDLTTLLFDIVKDNFNLNKVVNFKNFQEMRANILQVLNKSKALVSQNYDYPDEKYKVILYSDKEEEKPYRWLKEKPKFCLRLSFIKIKKPFTPNQQITNNGFLEQYTFETSNNTGRIIQNFSEKENKRFKRSQIQSLELIGRGENYEHFNLILDDDTKETIRNSSVAQLNSNITIIPVAFAQMEISENEFPLNYNNFFEIKINQPEIPVESYFDVYMSRFLPQLLNKLAEDPKIDLLANYCLDINAANTLALFNSLVGMNSEGMYKLFDTTKNVIKKNFILHKNSGNFKNQQKNSAYNKQKDSKTNGPPPLEMLKAAVTIPIGMLKGMATAVDPNIFLADKIVLAGKMGFIQPKYKRFSVGDKVPVKNSPTNEMYEIDSDGVAGTGTYELIDGVFKIKPESERNGAGEPLIDYIPVVETRTVNEKIVLIKNSEGKVEPKYGPPFIGVPWDPKADSALDPNFDEEDIGQFDLRPSTPIFPGESINIPYKVASLALAPFPLFTPGLTAYNIAMPFGPLFLGLEDLLAQNPQIKFATAKSPATDTGANLSCQDSSSEEE